MALLLAMFAGSSLSVIQPAAAVTTTNCTVVGSTTNCSPNAGGGNATFSGTERKVFEANGYWWIFWSATSGGGIDYQSCPATSITNCVTQSSWSTAALFTKQGATTSTSGQGFSAWVVTSGSTNYLVYVDAPTNGGNTLYWGVASLNAGTVSFLVQDQPFTLLASHVGTSQFSVSVTVDGNDYPWIAVFTHSGTAYYEDVYECPYNVITSYSSCQTSSNWYSTTSFSLATSNANMIDAPMVLPLVVGSSSYYVALAYINAASTGSGGPMDIYVSPSGSASGPSILWQQSCGSGSTSTTPSPCSTTTNMSPSESSLSPGTNQGGYYYSAVSYQGTIYVVSVLPGPTAASFSYTEGASGYSGYDSFISGATINPTLSYSGTNVVLTYITGGNVVFQWAPMADVSSGVNGWSAQTNLAYGTEWNPSQADASFTSYVVSGCGSTCNAIGVIWENSQTNPGSTQRIRFAVESMGSSGVVNFPVTVTVSLNQYNSPTSARSQISSSNYFVLSYTNSAGQPNTQYYTDPVGTVLTIPGVLSYSNFFISDQSSASNTGEIWCLKFAANSCTAGSGSAFTTLGTSDGVAYSYYYYDQLYQPSLYTIAVPSVYSAWATQTSSYATVNYDSTTTGSPISNVASFTLSPNPGSSTPWASPRIELYGSSSYDLTAQWARTRDITPGCSSLTTYPAPGSSATCAPSVSFQNPFGTSTSASPTVLTDTNANWGTGQWVGYSLEYTSGPAKGESQSISASTPTTITVGTAFSPAPTAAGGDSFTIVEPKVTVNNPGSGVTLPSSPTVLDYVPVVIDNYADSPTPAGFQQMATIDSVTYSQYEAPNLQNVVFFTGSGSVLPSWIESGATSSSSSTAYWLNLGANTVPAGTVGNSLGSGTSSSSTPVVLTDASAAWTTSQWVGDYIEYTSGPAAGQWLPIIANTPTTITAQSAFSPAPTAAGGDSFSIVYVNPGTLKVYMGFASASTDLFSATGPEGEAPQLSPTYGANDNGAIVFPALYANFAGTVLPSSFTTLSNPGFTVTQNDGITLATSSTATWGGIVTASGYPTTTPMTFEGDMTGVSGGTAAGIMVQSGGLSTSTGYGFNPWCTVDYGAMSTGQTCSRITMGGVNLSPAPGIIGESWVSGSVQYYYKDYAPVPATLSVYPLPGSAYYSLGEYTSSASNSISMQWVRLRVTAPSGIMPSITTGPVRPTSPDPASIIEYVPITVTNTQSAATPQYFQVDVNATSTAYATYENALLQNVEFFTDSAPLTTAGTVMPSWLESGNSNTAGDSVYWVQLPGSIGPGQTTTIYMGFASISTNLFGSGGWYNGANGMVGEAPTLSPTYGAYDNGANVFSFYDNFAGTTLSPNWAPSVQFGTGAQAVVGKLPGANTCTANLPTTTSGSGMSQPQSVRIDASGNLWVADACDNRILEYSAASLLTSNPSPILVIGQTGFGVSLPNEGGPVTAAGLFDPTGIAFDSSGNLWVADTGNNRVLEFLKGSGFTTGEAATTVVGQTSFNGAGAGTSATALNSPMGIAFDSSGDLWVADSFNNRILDFGLASSLPATGGSALVEEGQSSGSMATAGAGSASNQAWVPTSVAFDASGNLWATDTMNSRVLEYPASSLSSSGQSATVALGQTALNSGSANHGAAVSANGLFQPTSLTFDSSGNLWVADTGNNRILEFTGPFSTGESATIVEGQSSFTAGSANGGSATVTASGLYAPMSLAFGAGNLWVADDLNNRVLEFASSSLSASGSVASGVVGQGGLFTSGVNTGNTVSAASLNDPTAEAFDSSGNLWVADTGNNRILEFTAPFRPGEAASLVIGQPSFTSSTAGTSQMTLNAPTAIAFDSSGNLWVADTGNNRVLEFLKGSGFTTGEAAAVVLGQASFTTGTAGTTASTLDGPSSVTFDSSGNLWVADSLNNRVVEFPASTLGTSGSPAALAVGQTGLTTGSANDGLGSVNAAGLFDPMGIAFDSSGNLWVADTGNNRVLEFPSYALSSSGASAVTVIGQGDFVSGYPNRGGAVNQFGLNAPTALTFDSWGQLWVADTGNNRVLYYTPGYYNAFTDGQAATNVEGQTSWSGALPNFWNPPGISWQALAAPRGLAVDSFDSLWIADSGNSRVWAEATGWATGAPIQVNNGLSLSYANRNVGVVSTATFNPRTSILEVDAYFSSPNSGADYLGYLSPQGGSPVPQIGVWNDNLYVVTTENLMGQSGSGLFNGYQSSSSLIGLLNGLPTSPTDSGYAPFNYCYGGAGGLEPYPASGLFCNYGYGLAPTTNWWEWSLRNYSVTISPTVAGGPNEQWSAVVGTWPNYLNAPYQVTPVVRYYHQFAENFQVIPSGLVTTLDTGVSISLTGTVDGRLGQTIVNFQPGLTSGSFYVDAGTTVVFQGTGSGSPTGQRWENSNNQSQTVVISNSACTSLCTAYYYKQYQQYLQYKTSDGSTLPVGTVPKLTYYGFGTETTIPITSSTTPQTIWIDAQTVSNATAAIPGATPFERWVVPVFKWTVSCSNTVSGCTTSMPDPLVYYHQYLQQVTNYKTTDYLQIPGADGVPQIDYTVNGTAAHLTLNFTGSTYSGTSGNPTTATVLYDGSAAWTPDQWVGYTLEYTSGPASGQALKIISNTGGKVTTATAFNPAPTSGGGDSYIIIYLAWMDSGTSATATPQLPTSPTQERWVPQVGTWSISGSNCQGTLCLPSDPGTAGILGPLGTPANTTVLYDHQFSITYDTFPTASPSYPLLTQSCPLIEPGYCGGSSDYTVQSQGTSTVTVWQTTPMMLEEVGNATLVSAGFATSSPGICLIPSGSCVTSTISAITKVTLTGPGTIDVYFQLQEGITFVETGIPAGTATWTVNVYCPSGGAPSCTGGSLVKGGASSTSSLFISNTTAPYLHENVAYTYVVQSPVISTAGNVRHFATPTSGTVTLTASNPSQSVVISFSTQYLLTAISDPLWTATIQANLIVNGTGSPLATTCSMSGGMYCSQSSLQLWLLPGSSFTLTETTNPAQFAGDVSPPFVGWTDTGSCGLGTPPPSCQTSTISISSLGAPDTETANFIVGLVAQVLPSTESAYAGETVTTTAWSFGGIGTGTVSVNPASLPSGVSIDFYVCDPGCGAPQPNTFNFPTSTDPPDGAGIVMQVTVAPSATVYGAFPITVTVSYAGSAGQAGGTCGVGGLAACPVYTLDIITPQAVTLGPSNGYGILTPGQGAVTYANGNWLAFYFGRTSLVYNYSANGKTWNPGGSVPDGLVPGTLSTSDTGVHGYSFAVTTSGNDIYYVLSSTNNETAGSARPGNYFYWNWGIVQSSGVIVWQNPNAIAVGLCSSSPCPIYGAGQPSMLQSGSSLYVSIPVLADIKGSPMWLIQLWQSSLSLGVPGTWSTSQPPLPPALGCPVGCPSGLSTGILVRTPGVATLASGVNMKLVSLDPGAIGLIDWIGNDVSYPSVAVYNTATGLFTLWANEAGSLYQYSCTPATGGADSTPIDYTLFGQQSDAVSSGSDLLFFAGQNAAPGSAYYNDVVYYTFVYSPIGTICGAPSTSTSGYTGVGVVQGTAGGIPASPTPGQPWHVTLAYTSNSLTLGFGQADVLGTATGTCNSAGSCAWVVLPDSVQKVAGLITGLSSFYSSASGNIGTVWVETSPSSPTGFIVAFALI